MDTNDFDYDLPVELIAQEPIEPRDHSRLLVLDRKSGKIEHRHFYDVVDFFQKGDCIVMNNSKVFPARLIGKKEKTEGQVEVFLHRHIKDKLWQCIVGGKRTRPGLKIIISENLECELLKNNEDGTWEVRFNLDYDDLMKKVEAVGEVPLPPYIKRRKKEEGISKKEKSGSKRYDDRERYQTVYADDNKLGSVAAPTAGLHFTPELIEKLKSKGVEFLYITLHVGLGTFAPVKVLDAKNHKMHCEWVEISKETIEKIYKAKSEGRRVVAVGTTSVRSLEAMALEVRSKKTEVRSFKKDVDIFIYPGFEFKIVDSMITNFHLPKSTLLMLISAFAGKENIDKAYACAIINRYRFFSYGDSMLIF